MPSKANHIKRAKLNETFAVDIATLDKRYKYWIVTAYHYSSIHWIDAYLAMKSKHPHSHTDRGSWISRDSKLRKVIYGDYCDLKNLCRDARYELAVIGKVEIKNATNYHKSIKNHIQKLI